MRLASCFWPFAIGVGALALGVRGEDVGVRAKFMRSKLEYSKRVLDGLTREDFSEVAASARSLKTLSEAAEWAEAMGRPEAGRYAVYSKQFQALTDALTVKAEAKDLDGATHAYNQLIMNCVNCHKEIRAAKK
jgi:cytochrome c556